MLDDLRRYYISLDIRNLPGEYKFRSSHQRCSVKKCVLRNFAKLKGKHLCQSLFFNKVAGFRPATLLKKRILRGCFPVNFAKFLRTPFSQNTSGDYFCIFSLIQIKCSNNLSSENETNFEKIIVTHSGRYWIRIASNFWLVDTFSNSFSGKH